MTFDFLHFISDWRVGQELRRIAHRQQNIQELLKYVMATQQEAAAQMARTSEALTKIAGETQGLLDSIKKLQDAAANSDQVNPVLQAAIDDVAAKANAVDALVPDSTEIPPVNQPNP